ncbi:hypothetical protein [Virgibacillus alimentarius]|uniref:hypothetical protein n=1 Tax=Virgibacillus alimentarius TaxID=698769 RepID=UPI000AEBD99E|nr:hypothetical protein [Virgibacillus alimentarius]
MQALRYWDYYDMTETFTDLYDKSLNQQAFSHLSAFVRYSVFHRANFHFTPLTPSLDGT